MKSADARAQRQRRYNPGGKQHVKVGFHFPGRRADRSALRVHRHRLSCGRNREVSLFPVPRGVSDLFHHRHLDREKSAVTPSQNPPPQKKGANYFFFEGFQA